MIITNHCQMCNWILSISSVMLLSRKGSLQELNLGSVPHWAIDYFNSPGRALSRPLLFGSTWIIKHVSTDLERMMSTHCHTLHLNFRIETRIGLWSTAHTESLLPAGWYELYNYKMCLYVPALKGMVHLKIKIILRF